MAWVCVSVCVSQAAVASILYDKLLSKMLLKQWMTDDLGCDIKDTYTLREIIILIKYLALCKLLTHYQLTQFP